MAATFVGCHTYFSLRPADLLFHVASDDNAITQVTPAGIDHVAIYIGGNASKRCNSSEYIGGNASKRCNKVEKAPSIIEAIGRGVVLTSLDTLLHRESGYYIVGRVRGVDARRSIANAMAMLGSPYDTLFLSGNEAVYCSELVQMSFVDRQGKPIFNTIPMSFHDSTGHITPYWQQFYSEKGMSVPEGQPGTNPGELSRRPQVKLHFLRLLLR